MKKSRAEILELGRQSNWRKPISAKMVNNTLHLYKNIFAITEQIRSLTIEAINCRP